MTSASPTWPPGGDPPMTGFFTGDDGDDTQDLEQCGNCGREFPAEELRDDGYCSACAESAWTQECPECGSTAIVSETKDNPNKGTHAPGTITIWQCSNCGFTSGARHDWRWK